MKEDTMMKKWIAALAAIVLLSCPMTTLAAKAEGNQVPGDQGIEVYGYSQSDTKYYVITLGIPGMDSVELPGGVMLSGKSDSSADDELRVVIIPITADEEAEAYAWLSASTEKLGRDPAAYYLAFYRGKTPAQPEGSVTIAMTVRDGYEKAKLYYMDGNAKSNEVSYTAEQESASFGMKKTGYYLFVNTEDFQEPTDPAKPDDPTKPTDPVDPSKSTNPGTPQTGDNSNLWLWLVLLVASCWGFAATVRHRGD